MMHLDTVMTMVDPETFTKYAGLGMLPTYTVEPGDARTRKELTVTDHAPEQMHDAIAAALGLPEIRVLTTEQDVHAAEREQWDDGCNALAVAPGVVVTYERNEATNTHLRANGVEVLEIPGGGAGPRPWRPAVHELPDRARPPVARQPIRAARDHHGLRAPRRAAAPQPGWALAADDAAQLGQPLGQHPLGAVGRRPVVVAAHQRVGRVLLGQHRALDVVRVAVADRVAQLLRARVVPVAQVRRHRAGGARPHVRPSPRRSP